MFVRLVVVAALLAALGAGPAGKSTTLPLLPWHEARLDGDGRLLAWYHPERGLGYDRVLRLGWGFLERGVPVDRRAGVKVVPRLCRSSSPAAGDAYDVAPYPAATSRSTCSTRPPGASRSRVPLTNAALDREDIQDILGIWPRSSFR